jgi:sec-independent protein translocase protein TatA
MIHPLFLNLGSGEMFLIVLCIVMFFGTDKLPEMVRSFSRGMNQMKSATTELQKEIQSSAAEIQRDINAAGALDDLKEGAENLQKRIMEGASLEETEPIAEEPKAEENNPLTPDESLKREG